MTLHSGRCPAAHPDDMSLCTSTPDAVIIVDVRGGRTPGCTHHGAVLLAALDGARVHVGPAGVDAAALECWREAQDLKAVGFMKRVSHR